MKSQLIIASFVLLSFFNCTTNSTKTENILQAENTEDSTFISKESTKTVSETDNQESKATKFELLQGKWQHSEDKTNFLKFEGNHRMEIADGMEEWSDDIFVLSNKCQNESDKNNGIEAQKDEYLSVESFDMCWAIIELNEEILTLSYMGRGNILSYKRAK